jgi:hypothetical protein
MTAIIGIHGIGNYHYLAEAGSVDSAAEAVSVRWTSALEQGLAAYGHPALPSPGVLVAYYSHLLRRGTPQGGDDVAFLDPDAQELLVDWVDELAASGVAQGPRTARVRAAGEWLARHLDDRALAVALTFVREMSTYLRLVARRQQVRDAVADTVRRERPRVVIAHSLGTVVAYETLWRHPDLAVDLLVTLGSPLAMPRVVFDRLEPPPSRGRGQRPPGVGAWANLADIGDIVAIPREGLDPHFTGITYDNPAIVIDDNAFHSVTRYLAAPETAGVLARYL